MKRFILTMLICFMLSVTTSPVMGMEAEQQKGHWETYAITIGGFFSVLDTSIRFGSGLGLDLDVEELLGIDSTNTVFRVGGSWRFTDNQKHRLDLTWFAYHRSGSAVAKETITIENPIGDPITISPGDYLDSHLNIDIYQLAYSYSFLQDDRIDVAALFGLYVMPIDTKIEISGLIDEEGAFDFTAPLPTIGVRMDLALTPKWFFRSGSQFFFLEYQDFKGAFITMQGAVEYKPWDRVSFGLCLDTFNLKLESDGGNDTIVDFKGNIEFKYTGIELYTRIFF